MITLYDKPTCPFCYRVRLALGFLDVPHRLRDHREHAQAWRALTHAKTVPVLVHEGEGVVLTDSGIILEYLEDVFGDLLPPTPRGRARGREWLRYADNPVGRAVKQVVFERRDEPPAERDQERMARAEEQWHATLPAVEERLEGREFLVGQWSMATAALTGRVALAYGFGLHIPERFEHVRRWFRARVEEPFFRPASPPQVLTWLDEDDGRRAATLERTDQWREAEAAAP